LNSPTHHGACSPSSHTDTRFVCIIRTTVEQYFNSHTSVARSSLPAIAQPLATCGLHLQPLLQLKQDIVLDLFCVVLFHFKSRFRVA